MPAEARREQLLDAAAKVILEDGFDALTIESAANAAGVSRTLAYSYFGGIDGLLNELFAREFSAVYDRIGPALSEGGTFEDRIRRKVSAYFGFIEERRDILIQLRANIHSAQHREERRQRWSVWESYVADIIRQEFVVADDIARPLARILMSIDNSCVNIWYQSGLPRKLMEDVCCRFQLAGLADFLVRRRNEEAIDVVADGARSALSPQAAEILDHARRLVRSAGPDGLTMRELAAQCGLRPAALYVHFADKAAIADHLYEEIVDDYRQTLATALSSTRDAQPQALARALTEFTVRVRPAYLFAVRHGSLSDWALRDEMPEPTLLDIVCDGLVLRELKQPASQPVAESWVPVITAALTCS